MVITDDIKNELVLRFKSIYESNLAIESKNEEIKAFKAHSRELIKAIAETMETKQKVIKAAYDEYIKSVENPEETNEKDTIFAFLKEYNLVGLDKE
jgi:hypothetical protein